MWKGRLRHPIFVCLLAWPCLLAPVQGNAQGFARKSFFSGADHQLTMVPPSTTVPPSAYDLRFPPPANWRRPYSDFRLGIFETFLSTIAGRVGHEFSGMSTREMTMLGVEFGSYGSILALVLPQLNLFEQTRLRIGDYIRVDAGTGLQHVKHTEVELEEMRPLLMTTEVWTDLRATIGIQANFLVTREIEIGAVIGRFHRLGTIWDAKMDIYSIPALRGARLRYRNLAGEFQTATGPIRSESTGPLTYDVQDSYRALRLRYNGEAHAILGLLSLFGLDFEHWSHRLTKDGRPFVIRTLNTDTDATHSGTTLRFLVGVNL